MINQKPEDQARDNIDLILRRSGWAVQDKKSIDFSAAQGVAIAEYQTSTGPADYVLFVDGDPVGVVEAKREEEAHRLTEHEDQTKRYINSKLKYINNDTPLIFGYESTGVITHFTDYRDPLPRAREVFTFHRPETMARWFKEGESLRKSILKMPELNETGLRDCQINAIGNLERSFKDNKPKALVQMATGSGKTFTAVTSIWRLLESTKAKRVLFLVDTKNLGEQAESEFITYSPVNENRKFSEIYGVKRLNSPHIPNDNHVYISTIQRMYSILSNKELDESEEEINPNECGEDYNKKEPKEVVYNEKLPVEYFDFIIIDECHRSIYNVWKQVLDYFDAFFVGLTATPDNRTYAFFNENVVSEYDHEDAIADGVNVGYDTYLIDTKVSLAGGKLKAEENVEKREKLSRKKDGRSWMKILSMTEQNLIKKLSIKVR